jgi:hypothetical protein
MTGSATGLGSAGRSVSAAARSGGWSPRADPHELDKLLERQRPHKHRRRRQGEEPWARKTSLGSDAGGHQPTTVPSLYAAGDVAAGLNHISVAVGAAAIAVAAIHQQMRTSSARNSFPWHSPSYLVQR